MGMGWKKRSDTEGGVPKFHFSCEIWLNPKHKETSQKLQLLLCKGK